MIDLTKAVTVFNGRRGKHHFRNLEFDVSSLLDSTYPETALNAIYKRPDGIAYPVVTIICFFQFGRLKQWQYEVCTLSRQFFIILDGPYIYK